MEYLLVVICIIGYVCIYVYVRDLKRKNQILVEEQLESTQTIQHNDDRFQTLLNNLPDTVLTFDSKLRLIFANKVGKKLVNDAELQLLDQTGDGFTLSRTLTRVWFNELLHVIQHHEARIFEFDAITVTEHRIYEVHAVPDKQRSGNDQDLTIICVIRDVTTRKQLEEQRLKLSLEQQRVNDLRQLSDNIVHDIRNPLSAISTNAYLLRKNTNNIQHAKRLDGIDQNIKQIAKQLDNLLLMTRLDSNAPAKEKDIKLESLIYQLGQQFTNIAQQEKKIFVTDLANVPDFVADQEYLRIAIEHLLYNALSNTSPGDQIKLSVYTNLNDIYVDVQDNGIGLTNEQQDKVFERFHRCDSSRPRNNYTGGSGLGLSIVHAIVKRHNGTVHIDSKYGVGSTFSIRLPIMSQASGHKISKDFVSA